MQSQDNLHTSQPVESPPISSSHDEIYIRAGIINEGQDVTDSDGKNVIHRAPCSGPVQADLEDSLTTDKAELSEMSQTVENAASGIQCSLQRQPSDPGSGSPGSGDSLPIKPYSKAHTVYDSLSGQAQDCQPVDTTQDCQPESQWEGTQDLVPGSRRGYQQQVSCADSGTETDPLDPYCSATFKQVGFADMQVDSRSSIEVPDTTAGQSHDIVVGDDRGLVSRQDSGFYHGPPTPEASGNGDGYPGNSPDGCPQKSDSVSPVPTYCLASVQEQPMMDTSFPGDTYLDIDSDEESDATMILSTPESIPGVLGHTPDSSREDAVQLTDITALPEPSVPDILPHSTSTV